MAHHCVELDDAQCLCHCSLLAYTGLRFGELVGLRVEDVDLGCRRVRVRR